MKTDMDLFGRVLHAIEGEEKERLERHSKDGVQIVYRHWFGPDRWIEDAALGRLTAINALAVILFSVRNDFNLDNERRIVDGWATELRTAAEAKQITPRDPVTLLPLPSVPDGWDWLISIEDADSFVAARGMGWACSERVAYLLEQSRQEGERWYAEDGTLVAQYWREGCEPESEKGDTGGTAEGEQAPLAQDAKPIKNWMMKIQAEAARRWINLRSLNCNPTKLSLADELATWCKSENILTKQQINPSASYIYKHVLRPWNPPPDQAN